MNDGQRKVLVEIRQFQLDEQSDKLCFDEEDKAHWWFDMGVIAALRLVETLANRGESGETILTHLSECKGALDEEFKRRNLARWDAMQAIFKARDM